ncbi:Ras family protein [Trichomonas vaginalis G3]|uniref:Ras family protein n=1 Tax=Trichomonas vaginalis (strain ATCC PRA-98 / G3) TaxID=412133 RepID=A2DAY7_TRIV3|nr:retrograde vesicle-mediated transport, Golgi to ER [Trichomonas vaginalis G3]EAY22317.1 Ras family protein [Trichomonas vaginalis G3]KAI5518255.1 retrograde vesicle-mediated transport, Golgi to ER [Trichomonas vaginalis G3]|eukprot:XP_001583303.1 Ras family protein [Trichomonas vaginalis G3]
MTLGIHRVILLGDSAVGKTSIINQYIYNSSGTDYKTTIGIDYFTKNVNIDGVPVRLQIWDTAGQEKFHAIIPSYIRNVSIVILVFDITQRQSFDNVQKWYQIVTDITKPKFFLAGNKVDLELNREVTFKDAKKYADSIGATYIETSSRTPINITELFNQVASVPIATSNEPELEEKQAIVVKVDLNKSKQTEQGSNANSGCSC